LEQETKIGLSLGWLLGAFLAVFRCFEGSCGYLLQCFNPAVLCFLAESVNVGGLYAWEDSQHLFHRYAVEKFILVLE